MEKKALILRREAVYTGPRGRKCANTKDRGGESFSSSIGDDGSNGEQTEPEKMRAERGARICSTPEDCISISQFFFLEKLFLSTKFASGQGRILRHPAYSRGCVVPHGASASAVVLLPSHLRNVDMLLIPHGGCMCSDDRVLCYRSWVGGAVTHSAAQVAFFVPSHRPGESSLSVTSLLLQCEDIIVPPGPPG